MFGFKKKADPSQCRALVQKVRMQVDALAAQAAEPANKGMAEFYGTLYYVWLAREPADWKALEPYLGDAVLDSLRIMRFSQEERKELLDFIRLYWRALEKEEKQLLRQGKNPLRWLDNNHSGFPGIALKDPDLGRSLLTITGDLITRLDLTAYANFAIAPAEAPQNEPEKKLPLSDIRPQPPREPQEITMTDHQGNPTRLRLLDVIVTVEGAFACLVAEGETELMVLKTTERPDGSTAYSPVEDKTARLVYAIFKTRNPQFFEE